MTQITADQQRIEAAATNLTAKLSSFIEGLTPDERFIPGAAFRAADEVAGYKDMLDIALQRVERLPIWDPLQQLAATIARPIVWPK